MCQLVGTSSLDTAFSEYRRLSMAKPGSSEDPRPRQLFYLEVSLIVVNYFQVGYTIVRMQTNRADWNSFFSTRVATKGQGGVPFMPGLLLIVLGLTLVVAPRLVMGVLAFGLVMFGVIFCYIAYKLVAFRRQVQSLTKSFEKSFSSGGFSGHKADIDITDSENTKIVYH